MHRLAIFADNCFYPAVSGNASTGLQSVQVAKLLQTRLAPLGNAKKKAWWENYIKHDTHFLGVGLPQVEQELKQWYHDTSLASQSPRHQLDIALYLLAQQYAEEKLAGVLLLQKHLCNKLAWQTLLDKFTPLWHKKLIYDWSICDWFCLRVLRQLLDRHGMPCAEQIAAWHTAPYLWQARAALVPFVGRTQHADYRSLIMPSCEVLIKRPERFAKTAVGWMLREFSKTELQLVCTFLRTNNASLTREVVNNALKYYGDEKKKFLARL